MIFKSFLWIGCLSTGLLQACVADCPKNTSFLDPRGGSENDFFFVDEGFATVEQAEGWRAKTLSVFDRTLQPRGSDVLEETVAEIMQTDADVVCLHNLADEQTQYKVYDALRGRYGHFCMEKAVGGSALVASKYDFSKEECGFLDDDGVFFEANILDLSNNAWRIVMVRPEQGFSPESLRLAVENVAEQLPSDSSSLLRPTLFCGNLSGVDFCSSVDENLNGHEASEGRVCGIFLPPSFPSSHVVARIPLVQGFRGLFTIEEVGLPASPDVGGRAGSGYGSSGYGMSWGGSWAGVEVGASGDKWRASVRAGVKHDSNGNTSSEVHAEAHMDIP